MRVLQKFQSVKKRMKIVKKELKIVTNHEEIVEFLLLLERRGLIKVTVLDGDQVHGGVHSDPDPSVHSAITRKGRFRCVKDYPTVRRCFRHVNPFVWDRLKRLMDDCSDHGRRKIAHGEYALIEVTLFDHGLLWHRNHHRLLLQALTEWGLMAELPAAELDRIADSMSEKMRRVPAEGYRLWGDEWVNDCQRCCAMGDVLGDLVAYDR